MIPVILVVILVLVLVGACRNGHIAGVGAMRRLVV